MSTTPKSPDEYYLFTYSPKTITKDPTFTYCDHITTYFLSWIRCMHEFEVNPEFNQNGNLHYHGYFRLKDKVKWYKVVLPKMKYNGLIKINKVEQDLSKALEYCRKDRELMLKCISHKIPFTHTDKKPKIDEFTQNNLLDYQFTE